MSLPRGYHSPQVDVDVRLNTNESPWPPPAEFTARVTSELSKLDLNRYPDRSALRIREAIAARHGVDPDQVLCTNGSNEAIQLLLGARGGPGRRVLVFPPTYTLHSHLTAMSGSDLDQVDRGAGFALEPARVKQAVATLSPAIVFLCLPNNPTGTWDGPEVVDAALSGPGLVVVDEAYGEFAGMPSASGRVAGENLAVVRTFSKAWAMAGLRLGYVVADAGLVAELTERALPYHLDVVKQIAGRVALDFEEEMGERVRMVTVERARVLSALRALDLTVWDSAANFLLFRPNAPATQVWTALVDRSVLVRDLSGFSGLEGCLRVTIGTPSENDRFLEALAAVLGKGID